MDIYELLDEEQRYQLFIVRLLDLTIDEYISISKLEELTGQSTFKIKKYIHNINYDLHNNGFDSKVIVQDDVVQLQDIDLKVIKLLQIHYFETSHIFPLMIYLLEGQGTIDGYAQEHFLSTSKAYTARKQLITFFKPLGIKIKKGKFAGDELMIRNSISTIIFEALNGYYCPFSDSINQAAKKVIEFLTFHFDLRLTPTQKGKLKVLTALSLVRCKNDRSLDDSFLSSNKVFQTAELNQLSAYIQVDSDKLVDELSYLLMFLYVEGLLRKADEIDFKFDYFATIDTKSQQISTQILHQVEEKYQIQLPEEISHSYRQRVRQSNRRHAIYSFYTSSFSTNKQIQSVNEVYPVYSEIIWGVIKEHLPKEQHDLNGQMVRFFYDYLFILLDILPSEQVEKPIDVFVDFSQGKEYTKFIIKQIEGFKDLNLAIGDRLTSHTEILVSNCVVPRFKGKQIVWKNPPAPSDWEVFGDSIVQVKKERLLNRDMKRLEDTGE
ncbi:Mga helix-turn-helix domain-containing protein [Enterococcus malodoratus]|uniref:helix-turn-helix domain-containing protein n=1 Tax=Enterococcus malodoratus TaxID=71451 RepID=UPI0008CC2A20|nr:helix-turn-helix domain-containing protein [Enterococcus malodoratus]SET54470.1 Mga helix-turn-helix domain-containing protein [Enterococcus malodoratus]